MDIEHVLPALRERLGHQATGDLIELLTRVRKEWTAEVIGVVGDRFERRLIEEISKVRVEMATRQEMAQGFSDVRRDISVLRQELADQRFEILKWALLFWVGQFFAVASLVAVMIRFLRLGA